MPKIVTCFKWVKDEADIKIIPNSRELALDRVGYKISDYDRNAIEEGVQLQERYGGNVVAVTVGPPEAKPGLKDALSRGPEKAYFVNDPAFAELEPSQTAAVLAAAIKGYIEFDIIICAEGSSDLYAQQVGPRLAELLNIPCATYVNKLSIEDNQIVAERKLEDGVEIVTMPMPALVTVLPEINTPRLPTLKQVLSCAKKPVENIGLADIGQLQEPGLKTISVLAATMERRREKYSAENENIRKIVDALIKEGILV